MKACKRKLLATPPPNSSSSTAAYDLVSDLDEAGDRAMWAAIESILAKRAAVAEKEVGLPGGSIRQKQPEAEK